MIAVFRKDAYNYNLLKMKLRREGGMMRGREARGEARGEERRRKDKKEEEEEGN